MVDVETFAKNSPFKLTHSDSQNSYNLTNTTPDLLKFQLQEQYRNQLQDLKNSELPELKLLNTQIFENSFNDHLQNQVELGNIESLRGDSTSPESTMTSVFSEEEENIDEKLETVLASSSSQLNYLNLKVLIENSVFDTRNINKNALLSLSELSHVKSQIETKKSLKQYLLSKITIAQQFINDIIFRQSQTDSETDIANELSTKSLIKIMNSSSSLQSQLITVSTELEELTNKLTNHNLSCLVLGYIEDIKVSSTIPIQKSINSDQPPQTPLKTPSLSSASSSSPKADLSKVFDTLFANVASIAASRNIKLPQPPSANSELPDSETRRSLWIQQCIDTILSNTKDDVTPAVVVVPPRDSSMISIPTSPIRGNINQDKILIEYKTALNDLRFSYQYLAKEYEHSRDSFNKMIMDYKKKIGYLENELARNSPGLVSPPITADTCDSLEVKEREISHLRKELNLLRVDNIRKDQSLSPGSASSADLPDSTVNSELLQMIHLTTSNDEGSEASSLHSNRPSSGTGLSNGILRKEFRKIVSDIQDKYELELTQERLKRRQLIEELEQLKQS